MSDNTLKTSNILQKITGDSFSLNRHVQKSVSGRNIYEKNCIFIRQSCFPISVCPIHAIITSQSRKILLNFPFEILKL